MTSMGVLWCANTDLSRGFETSVQVQSMQYIEVGTLLSCDISFDFVTR